MLFRIMQLTHFTNGALDVHVTESRQSWTFSWLEYADSLLQKLTTLILTGSIALQLQNDYGVQNLG